MNLIAMMNQRFDDLNKRMNRHFDSKDQRFHGFIEDLRRGRRSKALPGQQARPEGKGAHNEESSESKDDYTADGEGRVTPSKKRSEFEPDLVQLPLVGRQENSPASVSRPIESDHNKGVCHHESTLRDPSRGKVLFPRTAQIPSNAYQRRSISSHVAVVNATAKTKYGAIRHQPVPQNKTATTTKDENKFFDPGGEQDFCVLQSRPIAPSGRA